MSEKLSDECLGVMKFAASQCIFQLAMFGSLGGEQFYGSMREGLDADEQEKTEKIIAAIKTITEAMGGESFGPLLIQAAARG